MHRIYLIIYNEYIVYIILYIYVYYPNNLEYIRFNYSKARIRRINIPHNAIVSRIIYTINDNFIYD